MKKDSRILDEKHTKILAREISSRFPLLEVKPGKKLKRCYNGLNYTFRRKASGQFIVTTVTYAGHRLVRIVPANLVEVIASWIGW